MANKPEFTYWSDRLAKIEPNGNTEIVIPPLPKGIKHLDMFLFSYCENVESVVFSEGIKSFYSLETKYCKRLKKITLPSSLKNLQKVFEELQTLETVILSEGTEVIETEAFRNCSALKTVVLPSTLKTVGASAFEGCVSLESLTLPKGIETVGADAFKDCPRLTLSFEDGTPEKKKTEISALLQDEYTLYEVCCNDAEDAEKYCHNGCRPYASDGIITLHKVAYPREKFLELFSQTLGYHITEKNSTYPENPQYRRVRTNEAVFMHSQFFGICTKFYDGGEWSDRTYEVIREPSYTPLIIDIDAGFVRTASSYLCRITKGSLSSAESDDCPKEKSADGTA